MNRELFKELMTLANTINSRITVESKAFDILLEDNMGVPKGLAMTSDELVSIIGNAVGNVELCFWHIYDNDFGDSALEVDGQEIVTLDDLYNVINGTTNASN